MQSDRKRQGLSWDVNWKINSSGRGYIGVQVFIHGGYGGGGDRKKIGGDFFWILQYPDWPQFWSQIGTERDAPVQHGPKHPAGDQDHRWRLFTGFSGIFRHCLRRVDTPPRQCGNFLQRFTVLHSGGTPIARPKSCQIPSGDGRAPRVSGELPPS